MKSIKEQKLKIKREKRRVLRTRRKLLSQKKYPRLSVFKSNMYMSAQIIDDIKGVTLASAHVKELKTKDATPTEKAASLGELIAQKAKARKIKKVVFDKGGYKYHGKIKKFADSAREGGLEF